MPVYSEEQLKEKLIKELDTEHCEVMHMLGKMDAELRGIISITLIDYPVKMFKMYFNSR